jgi:pyridoxal phosphate enzyme (YggS family)
VTIAGNYHLLLQEIADEAKLANRNPSEIKLVVVSKTHPWEVVREGYEAGCRSFGENRVQEALEKMEIAPKDSEWHLIGTLQKNKVNKAVGVFSLIHSVDSLELAEKINDVSLQKGVVTPILLQVNVSGEESKHGFTAETVTADFTRLKSMANLRIEGLMTMAPFTEDANIRRDCFKKLRVLRDKLGVKELSMGMSNDWREAVQEGATILRVGSAIFGSRYN